ncbi:MAG: HAD hydrolase family protein, partial [Nitrososphaerales archaeon]
SYLGTTKVSVGENGGVVAVSPLDIRILGDKSYGVMAYDHLSRRIDDVEIKPTMPRFTEVVLKRSFDLDIGRKILEESGLPVKLIDSTFAYHITNKGVNKGRGLKVALEYLGVESSEVVAIGDSDTDIPMFKTCGSSIAVGNATEGARKNATYQVDSPLGEGLIDALHLSFQKILGLSLEEVLTG